MLLGKASSGMHAQAICLQSVVIVSEKHSVHIVYNYKLALQGPTSSMKGVRFLLMQVSSCVVQLLHNECNCTF